MSSVSFRYSIGDIRARFACRTVIVTTAAEVTAAKKQFAADHGLPLTSVWSELIK